MRFAQDTKTSWASRMTTAARYSDSLVQQSEQAGGRPFDHLAVNRATAANHDGYVHERNRDSSNQTVGGPRRRRTRTTAGYEGTSCTGSIQH